MGRHTIHRREFLVKTSLAGGFLGTIAMKGGLRVAAQEETRYKFSLFTKPWKMAIPKLGDFVRGLGFDGIELPVRPGYQVTPERVAEDLPPASQELAQFGLSIFSVAGPTDENTIYTCGELGIPLIRIMVEIPKDQRYQTTLDETRKRLDSLLPMLEKNRVTIGVQNHCGRFIANAAGLSDLVAGYDPKHVAAVWDPGHEALCGTEPDLALDMVESHLSMVNLKNGIRRRKNGPEEPVAEWETWWTAGKEGFASWPQVAEELDRRKWKGVVCLCAEYDEKDAVDRLIVEDFDFARSLFG